MSRMPMRLICRVRGIGVAVSVRTSTFSLSFLIFSLCATPKRCSSSMIRSPRFLKTTSLERTRCVPITTSTCPFSDLPAFFLLARRAETRQHIDPDREILHSLHKGIVMLLRQNCGRHQIHNLLPLLNRLKCRPERDLRLAISNVAADQAVHDAAAFHIFFVASIASS